MKGKSQQPRILYPAKLLFRFDSKIKSLTDKQQLREFRATRPVDKGNSPGGKEKTATRNKKIMTGKFTGKGKHTVKAGNHSHTNMIPNPATMSRIQMQENGNTLEIKRPTTHGNCKLKIYNRCTHTKEKGIQTQL